MGVLFFRNTSGAFHLYRSSFSGYDIQEYAQIADFVLTAALTVRNIG